jgi:hypothetical protein
MNPIVTKEVKSKSSTTHPVMNSTTCPPTKTLTVRAEITEEEEVVVEEEKEKEEEEEEEEGGGWEEMRSYRSD